MAVTINASTSTGLVQSADTSGQIELQTNGTTKLTVSSTGVNIGQYNPSTSLITSGTAVASTSGTSIDFTGIPSWVKRITVMLNRVSTNGSSNFLARLGTSSGVVSSGYSCACAYSNASGASTSNFTTGIGLINAFAASDTISGLLIIANVSGNIWSAFGNFNLAANPNINYTAGNIDLGGTLDRVRITTVGTDTFDAGSINILYE